MSKQMDARWRKRWRIERERGHLRLVDVTPVKTHLEQLLALGMSKRSIATAAGVSPTTVLRVLRLDYGTIQRSVATRLLAVQGPQTVLARTDTDDETFVPALGARRRIRALIAMGWTHELMHAHSGVRTAVTLNQAGEWITVRKHRQIAAMYEQLSMTPGPSSLSRARAARRGYAPPLAWDDIDDPRETPDVGTSAGGLDLDEVEWLEEQGYPLKFIAERLGVTRSAIEHARSRASRVSKQADNDRISA